ncbi:FHS family L-fucose permease-like MFS transporter [Rhizomicrobium palustre]|uniref:FHS family L-fucose permease-like MFS transporter n=1 Tax=Rhizomicrobium palustre TaxID=189966 RepID=A0A846N321_9PROT|nr:MFS transporter [Rhizomicrobium palustre]NIK90414.1 FHS family L-fucose permease-like MFS transporter [Rhizomicrobium palustre]
MYSGCPRVFVDKAKNQFWQSIAAICVTALAVALWGFAHRLYTTLLPDLAMAQALSSFEMDLSRAGLAVGYALMTLPTAFIIRNFGYKIGLIAGLGFLAIGLFIFYPAVEHRSFAYFLFAAVMTGSGLALMEVVTVALAVFLGPRDTAMIRSNLTQAMAPLGALGGYIIGERILQDSINLSNMAHMLVLPLFTLGGLIVALMFLIDLVEFPSVAGERVSQDDSTWKSFSPPFHDKNFRGSAAALFLCLGAMLILSGAAMHYAHKLQPGAAQQNVLMTGFAVFALGRLVGPLFMLRFRAMTVLAAFSGATVLCCAAMTVLSGRAALWALWGACFFASIQFPTIFAMALRDMKEMAKTGAAVLVFVAFCGSAVLGLTVIMIKPLTEAMLMTLPGICSAGIMLYAIRMRTVERKPVIVPGALEVQRW